MMKISVYKAEDLAKIVAKYALEYQELYITLANSARSLRTTNDVHTIARMTARMEALWEVYNALIRSFGELGIINTGKAYILRIDFITASALWDEESMMQRVMDIFYIDED